MQRFNYKEARKWKRRRGDHLSFQIRRRSFTWADLKGLTFELANELPPNRWEWLTLRNQKLVPSEMSALPHPPPPPTATSSPAKPRLSRFSEVLVEFD